MHIEDLPYLSATAAGAAMRAKQLSPVELTKTLIARAEALDPLVNAFTRTHFERALEQARLAERKFLDGTARPLEGLPIAIKDLHPIAGEVSSHGSLLLDGNRDDETHPMVARLLDAGAILLARTAVPEFGAATITHNRRWGVTRNPWNLAKTCGGSSGGAGAALAAGLTPLADGSDFGGSIRIPAACCGLHGYKPPLGRNPVDAALPMDPFLHDGPLARCLDDVVLFQNVVAGQHPLDVGSLPTAPRLPEAIAPARGLRIALCTELGFFRVDREVRENLHDTARALESFGCEVTEVQLPWSWAALDAYEAFYDAELASSLATMWPGCRDQLCEYIVAAVEHGRRTRFSLPWSSPTNP